MGSNCSRVCIVDGAKVITVYFALSVKSCRSLISFIICVAGKGTPGYLFDCCYSYFTTALEER